MQEYARRAKDWQLLEDATEIRLRARRELGLRMAAQKAAGLMAKGTKGQLVGRGIIGGVSDTPPIDTPITLEEAGIDKNLAKRSRNEAAKSVEEFEHYLVKAKQKQRDAIEGGKGLSKRQAAKVLGVSHTQIERDVAQKVPKSGTKSATKKPLAIVPPRETFETIVVDPPWPMTKIERDARLSNRAHVHGLPPSWGTLYEISKLDDAAFEAKHAAFSTQEPVPMLAARHPRSVQTRYCSHCHNEREAAGHPHTRGKRQPCAGIGGNHTKGRQASQPISIELEHQNQSTAINQSKQSAFSTSQNNAALQHKT